MSSALVGNRKDIQPQNLCTSYLSWNELPSTPLPSPPSLLLSEKDTVDSVKEEDVWRCTVTREAANLGDEERVEEWL